MWLTNSRLEKNKQDCRITESNRIQIYCMSIKYSKILLLELIINEPLHDKKMHWLPKRRDQKQIYIQKKNTKQKASVTETGIHKQDCQQEGYNTEDSK